MGFDDYDAGLRGESAGADTFRRITRQAPESARDARKQVPCYLFYRLLFRLELKMASSLRLYRIFRQCWRMFLGSFAVHVLGTAFHARGEYPDGAPLLRLSWTDGQQ